MLSVNDIINEDLIHEILSETKNTSDADARVILEKARKKNGLTIEEIGCLVNVRSEGLITELFDAARQVKAEIYGERLVLFAPLYVSNYCVNNCEYCGFRQNNSSPRKKLSLEEVAEQVKILESMGHKRLLLEFGEDQKESPIDYVVEVIKTIYATKCGRGEIRRVNVNLAADTVENYRQLKNAGIGTYQLFQETYDRKTYERLHQGPKADYERQLFAMDSAFEAGIDDVGLGVLFGLYDWKFEVLALVAHAQYLEKKFSIGPHTISVPRWQKAEGSQWQAPPASVSDDEFFKIIAILRLSVPYTGMIISTRERPEIRGKAFEIGISQTSAASKTSPGGYGQKSEMVHQFSVADERSVDEVIANILARGLLPSFCTACYRLKRTGENFMKLAKPGEIKSYCCPNAILTFQEYLADFASPAVKEIGAVAIQKYLSAIDDFIILEETKKRLARVVNGERDIYF